MARAIAGADAAPEGGGAVFEGFEPSRVDTGEATLRVRHGGSGPPLLLLHGYPQTHALWHKVAPRLARDFSVPASWRDWAGDVRGRALDRGHYLAEEAPDETYTALHVFFADG